MIETIHPIGQSLTSSTVRAMEALAYYAMGKEDAVSFLYWSSIRVGDRSFWRINESICSDIAVIKEGAD